jgi:hypothetical protein
VPEDVNFYPALTGLETLTYFAQLKGLSRRDNGRVSARLPDSVHLHAPGEALFQRHEATPRPSPGHTALSQDPILSPFFVNPTQLAVPATHKLAVLEHLLKDQHLTDIHLQSPTLPELYQHFVAYADQESNQVQIRYL